MEKKEYVAALDLGTSKILVMAASKDSKGVLNILASEKVESGTSIRRGFIYNIEEAATKVSFLTSKLSNKLRPGLKKIYVGIGGQSLRSEYYTVKKEINGASVTNEVIDSLYEQCKQYQPELAEILDIVSPEYYLDGRPESKPIGVSCKVIEAQFQLILGRPSLKVCLKKSIEEKAKLEIADFFVSPLATADAVLTAREKELGCALIEFGAGVTYLSVYKNGLLRHMVAIPLGGSVITKDLCSTNLLEQDAEELKINKGSALSESEKEDLSDIIIEARMNEIIANVIEQIQLSGYKSSLAEGIVITGGGSLLRNLSKSIQLQTNLEVRMGVVNKSLLSAAALEENALITDPAYTTLFGLLTLGKENCAKEIPKFDAENIKSSAKESLIQDMFGEDLPEPVKKETEKRKPVKKAPRENLFTKFKKGVEGMSRNLFDSEEENSDE